MRRADVVVAGAGILGFWAASELGRFLTQDLSWRWTLYVNLVFAAIAVAGALIYMRSSMPSIRPRLGVIALSAD
jgi:predicted MFS family arabinose efflux permease